MKAPSLLDLSHPIHSGMTTQPTLPPPVVADHMGFVASRMHYAPGVEFRITRVDMVGNTGTYLDAPGHRYAGGPDVAGVPLERMADLPGVVVRIGGGGGGGAGGDGGDGPGGDHDAIGDLRSSGDAGPAGGAGSGGDSGPGGRAGPGGDPRSGRSVVGSRAIDRRHLAHLDVSGCAVLFHTGWDTHWGTELYAAGVHPFLTAEAAADLRDRGAVLVGVDTINVDDTSDPERPAHTILLGAGIPIVENLTGLGGLPYEGFRFSAVPPGVAGMGSFPVRAWARVG